MKNDRLHRALAPVLFLAFVAAVAGTPPCHAASGDCGQPVSAGSRPLTNDCLYILRAAIGLVACEPCVCDTDGNGSLFASDAQRCLRAAVGLGVALRCGECATTTTSTPTSSSTSTTTTTTTTLPDPNPALPGDSSRTLATSSRVEGCSDKSDCASRIPRRSIRRALAAASPR